MKHEAQEHDQQFGGDKQIKHIIVPQEDGQQDIGDKPRIIAYADDILFYTGNLQELQQENKTAITEGRT
jgi:hypothetical protein